MLQRAKGIAHEVINARAGCKESGGGGLSRGLLHATLNGTGCGLGYFILCRVWTNAREGRGRVGGLGAMDGGRGRGGARRGGGGA